MVDECPSNLLYGNPDQLMGGGDNKNKNDGLEPRHLPGVEPSRVDVSSVRQRCFAVCRAEHETSAERYANAGVCVRACVRDCVVCYRIVQRLCVFFLLFLLLRLVSLYLLISRTSE